MYAESVAYGYDFPHFEGDAESFTAIVPLERHSNFTNFVQRHARDFQRLESLLMLKYLYKYGQAPIETLAKVVQRPQEYARDVTNDLRRRNILVADGPGLFELAGAIRYDIDHPFDPRQGALFG